MQSNYAQHRSKFLFRTTSVPVSSASCTEDADSNLSNEDTQNQRNNLVNHASGRECQLQVNNNGENSKANTACFSHPEISAMSVLSLYQNETDLDSEMDTSR